MKKMLKDVHICTNVGHFCSLAGFVFVDFCDKISDPHIDTRGFKCEIRFVITKDLKSISKAITQFLAKIQKPVDF